MKGRLIVLGLLMASAPAWAINYSIYGRIMEAVETRDLNTLKRLASGGVNMNSMGPNGQTPLCSTVAQGDYEGYELLVSQGASPYVACMRELPPETVQSFYANQPAPHTYYTGYGSAAHVSGSHSASLLENLSLPTLGAGEALIGAGLVGAVIAFGHGSSGGGGDDPKNNYKWDAPLNLDPKTFSSTPEYNSTNVDGHGARGVNYLSAINAANAYARGYTGYKVKREKDGTLIGEGEEAISLGTVKVGVVDSGVYTSNSKLADNILQDRGTMYNFVYGVCSSSNSELCWRYVPEATTPGYGKVQLVQDYGSSSETLLGSYSSSAASWKVYELKYGKGTTGYVYDDMDAAPQPYDTWDLWSTSQSAWSHSADWIAYSETTGEGEGAETKWYLYDAEEYQNYRVTCTDDSCSEGSITITVEGEDTQVNVKRTQEYDTHGTRVAGLIGATKSEEGDSGMMGVAYNVSIIPFKLDFDLLGMNGGAFPTAVKKADIVNLSVATVDSRRYDTEASAVTAFNNGVNKGNIQTGYQQAAINNTILVFAAGNYRHAGQEPFDSSLYSMAPLSSEYNSGTYNLTNLFVNVVAVTPNNDSYKLASYSAKCGYTKDYCIAAPGGEFPSEGGPQIYSTSYNDTYEAGQGTSFAAPIVSGALAVIKGAFPHLTNQQVVQILFETATDLGDPGVDDIYGRGLVNLAAATDPVGLTQISLTGTTNGEKEPTTTSSASIPTSMAGVAKALPAKIMVLDKYDRGFQVPTSSFVHVAKRENKLNDRFKSFMSGDGHTIKPTDMFEMSYTERRSDRYSEMQQGSLSVLFRPTETMSFKTYYSENTATSGGTYFDRVLMSPYAKMKEAWGTDVTFKLGNNWQASILGQVGQNGFVDEDDLRRMDHNRASLFQSTLQYNGIKRLGIKMAAGVANEQGSVLGMWGRGAFKTGNSKTAYVGAGLTFNVTDKMTVEGMYYYGSTQVANQNSLMNLSGLTSDSFAVTASWRPNDKRMIGFQFMSPLRIRRGTATVNMPVARDAYANVVYRNAVRADLKPTAREYDMGMYYTDEIAPDTIFQTELGVRLNPDHVAGAAPDWRALVGLSVGM